jgi:hypothetical protein
MSTVYQAAPGAPFPVGDAQKIGSYLERRFGEKPFRPRDVVAAARSERSVLHPYFEWDDAAAAEAYREEQAAAIVRHLVVVERRDDCEIPTRAFERIRVRELGAPAAYVAQQVVWRDPVLANDVLAQARRELESWRRRYAACSELAGALALVGAAVQEIAA